MFGGSTAGVRTGKIPVPVKGVPSGGAKGTPALKSGGTYSGGIDAACKAGAAEGMRPSGTNAQNKQ